MPGRAPPEDMFFSFFFPQITPWTDGRGNTARLIEPTERPKGPRKDSGQELLLWGGKPPQFRDFVVVKRLRRLEVNHRETCHVFPSPLTVGTLELFPLVFPSRLLQLVLPPTYRVREYRKGGLLGPREFPGCVPLPAPLSYDVMHPTHRPLRDLFGAS